MTNTDYAVFEDTRKEILHHTHVDPQSLAELLFRDAQKSLVDQQEHMTVHHVGDRKFIVMTGPGARGSDCLWSWRLLEFKRSDEGGKELSSLFDSVEERHFAPVVFMDREYEDDDGTLTFQHFTPHDRFHYPLSSVAQIIQDRMVEIMKKTKVA